MFVPGKNLIDLSRMDFLCPICRRLANVLLPDVNDYMALKLVQHEAVPITTELEAPLVTSSGLSGGPDVDISVCLYNEKPEIDQFWVSFWEANRNLAEVISVFASQVFDTAYVHLSVFP